MATINYSKRISEIMQIKGISKKDLADATGVAKQNINLLIETNNVQKLISLSKVLGVSLYDIVGEEEQSEPEVKGCIVYKGAVHPINSKQDIKDILKTIK